MSTPNRMQAHWNEVEVFIRKEWPRLTPTAVKNIRGNFDRFLKCLKDTYNNFPLEEAKARDKLQNFLNTLREE